MATNEMKYFLLVGALLIAQLAIAQEAPVKVSGVLVDGVDGSGLVGATVILVNIKDSLSSRYSVTDVEGAFLIEKVEKAFYRMQVSSVGYKPYTRVLRIGVVDQYLGRISVQPDTKLLEAVEIKGEVVPIEVRGDTIVYNADAFKVNPDANTKDLVSKMPGIVVDGSGVTANGETIEQVLLDGKRFFGQDPLLSLNTIPAEVVKQIEVFDERSEQSQFTGFDDGNTTKTMNVVTREGKRNGTFGKLYGGYGSNDHYSAGGNVNSFKDDKRITIIGMSNNINQQNFSGEDLAGVSGGGGRGGFRQGGNRNFMTGTQDGITNTNSLGLNFTNKWGKAAVFEGSYFFNQTDNTSNQLTSREFVQDNELYTGEENSSTDNMNHRLNMRLTYDINKKNKLIIRPSLSFQDNESLDSTKAVTRSEMGQILNQTNNKYTSQNDAYNFNNNINFQHKFEKIGRTISVEVNTRINTTDRKNYYEEELLDSLTEYLTDENGYTIGSTLTYTEPVGNTGQLSATYRINYTDRASDKHTYLFEPETQERVFNSKLSNEFASEYTTHQTSLFLSNRGFGKFFNAGITYQHATLNNNQVFPEVATFNKPFNSILPSVMGRFEFNGGGDMFIRYSTDTNEPSVNQLQNVIDNSNPLFWSIGNPDLKQSYEHSLMMRAAKTNPDKNTSISNFTRVQMTSNYVTNATQIMRADSVLGVGLVIKRGAQISEPVNFNGYWNINNNTTYGFLISKLKTNLNTTAGLSYRRQPGRTNRIPNIANTYSGNARLALVSNINENVDFNIYYNISANTVVNSIRTRNSGNSNYITQTFGGKFNLIFWKGFVFRNDIFYQKYKGVNDSFSTSYTLWNMSIAKKFLKDDLGELELSVFDLLGQNRSFSQSVNPSYIEETWTKVLQQYFMVTFTYQLRNFSN
ncbi:MAG: outer membrane beta-barrel protein [Bacteroidetes bacterium]|nr:outer membrane beta-barrel protein [Bacteroidota bacterium]